MIAKFAAFLAAQSDLPWQQFTFLGHGHTISCDVLAADPALSAFSALLLVKDPPGAPGFELPEMGGDPVNLLWTIPITAADMRGRASIEHLGDVRRSVQTMAEEAALREPEDFARTYQLLMKGAIIGAMMGDTIAARRARGVAKMLIANHEQ